MPSPSTAVVFGLSAALCFGVSSITAKRGLGYVNRHTGTLISLSTTVALYLLSAPWWMRSSDWFTPGFWIFVVNGLMHPMLSMYLAFEATSRTGATVAATLSSTTPLFAAAERFCFSANLHLCRWSSAHSPLSRASRCCLGAQPVSHDSC